MGRYPHRIVVDGREQLSRAGAAELFDLSVSHLANLWSQHANRGHPQPVTQRGPTLYWDAAELHDWLQSRRTRDIARLTEVDTSGDPQELVDAAEAARMLDYSGPEVILRYLTKNPGYFPDPDVVEERPNGSLRRFWRRAAVTQFAHDRGHRDKGGRPAGTGKPRAKTEAYAGHPFKPLARDAVQQPHPPTVAQFADRTGLPEYTARRLLAAARAEATQHEHNAQQDGTN